MNTPSVYNPVGPGNISDIRSILQNLFGYYSPTGEGFGGADWEYIFSVIILIMFLYFILSIIRGFFKK